MTAHPDWPHRTLDVPALRAAGHRPKPFREFVLKIHQQCNLACDYCYVYELADRTWRDRPRRMGEAIWRRTAERIAEHAETHGLTDVGVVLHGGEPLLAGMDWLKPLVRHLRATMGGSVTLRIGMQTNGTLLAVSTLVTLRQLGIRVGISLDGTAIGHDRHRVYRHGRGSHRDVQTALERLRQPEFAELYAGLLCVIDPADDPVEVYENLVFYDPPVIDFLLPHFNWTHPPARYASPTPYGDWLSTAFDRWYGAPRRETGVRIFDELLHLLLGGASTSEQVGLSPSGVAVVESDGSIELVDSLKSAYDGACTTGMHVESNSFDDALEHPGFVARQIGIAALSRTCLECDLHPICGGGHYAHRYRAPDGFCNPSVYCADLQVLIANVRDRVATDLLGRRQAASDCR